MKRLLSVLSLVVVMATVLVAKDFTITACTSDRVKASLVGEIADSAPPAVWDNVRTSFESAAKQLIFEDLSAGPGYKLFMEGLTDESKEAISIYTRPAAVGRCD